MGNETHIAWGNDFDPEEVTCNLEEIRQQYFPFKPFRFEYVPEQGAWLAKFHDAVLFDFWLETPGSLSFVYSRYGDWGHWTRQLTLEALAACYDAAEIWDDSEGPGETWKPDPEKFDTYPKYVNFITKHMQNRLARCTLRWVMRRSAPKEAR